ncbi:NINE protein [Halomicroarcula sp. GCM10025709]|uniref:NINE protein n=1 Tax=Haloarcula TaxID=2237 RepID=UPI0024C3D43C|nr:NINE protein [Halomicroarcula sp. YJ-61-S]
MSPDDDTSDDRSDPTEEGDAPLDEDDWVEFDETTDDRGAEAGGPEAADEDTGASETEPTDSEETIERAPAGKKYCHSCGTTLDADARFCSECGAEQSGTGSTAAGSTAESPKDRVTAGVLAILLGGLGAHHFYLGNIGIGVLYLCFFWTGIPALAGLIEGILYLTKTDAEFQRRYVDDADTDEGSDEASVRADDGGNGLGEGGDGGGE